MATFTWTATGSSATAWETTAAWWDSADSVNAAATSFAVSPYNDFVVGGENLLTINNISDGDTDIANSLTVTDPAAFLMLYDPSGATAPPDTQFDVLTTLSLNSVLNLGTVAPQISNPAPTHLGSVYGTLAMGDSGGGGTIDLGSFGRLEGAYGDTVTDVGSSATEIMGSGTVIAVGGLFQMGTSVQVAAGDTTQFLIDVNATLGFCDAVAGGTICFSSGSGSGVLDVAALSSFNAQVKGLYVGTGENTETSYIDFINVGTTASATLTNITTSTATLTVFTNSGSQAIALMGNYVGKYVNYLSDGSGGTNVFLTNAPCYVAGSAILTRDGEVAVETIQAGDAVMTLEAGRLVPRKVIWAGVREIDIARHPKPAQVAPIRFCRGALGEDLPHRDLLVSPDHCMFIDGGLFPAKLLVNGMTIVRDLTRNTVSYHHIELERHGVVFAEGVAAESYLDTGNRAYFSNAGLATMLHPEFAINAHLRCWETDACAPLMTRPEVVRPVWERFARRARGLGYATPEHATTTDPGICLNVDGRTLRPLGTDGLTVSFLLPDGAGSVRLMSRATNPGVLRPWLDDPRDLGVAVRSFALRDRSGETVLGADHPALTVGWHAAEYAEDGSTWRWSDGGGVLPILANGPCLLEITLSETITYLADGARLAA